MRAPVFRAGKTYGVATEISEDAAHRLWGSQPTACDGAGDIVGTYVLEPNQGGPGAHVANCGYVVAQRAPGCGVAAAMCRHAQREAVARGFRAMPYDLVVATNAAAIGAWRHEGFAVARSLPGAFRHPRHGDVDACVMFKTLA